MQRERSFSLECFSCVWGGALWYSWPASFSLPLGIVRVLCSWTSGTPNNYYFQLNHSQHSLPKEVTVTSAEQLLMDRAITQY